MVWIDGERAQSRIAYEQMVAQIEGQGHVTHQMLLVPQTIELPAVDAKWVTASLDHFHQIGISIRPMGGTTFLVDAIPVEGVEEVEQLLFDSIEQLRNYGGVVEREQKQKIARLAARRAVGRVKRLSLAEAARWVDEWLGCDQPWESATGEPVCVALGPSDIEKLFEG
jgi:DNA mismatch repair protein MutL